VTASPPPVRRCPVCGTPVRELLSPDGRRRRGRPRVFCSRRCRLGDRRSWTPPDPSRRRQEVDAFAAAVRAAVAAHGLPLRELAAELAGAYPSLASSVATLSAWQSGSSAPPRTVVGRDRVLALERCLRLPTGALALLLPGGAAVPAPRPPTPAEQDGPLARRARLTHLVGTVGGPQQVLLMTLAKDARLDPAGRLLSLRVTARVRALHDGVDRLWYLDGDDPLLRPVVIEATGCRPDRRVPERGRPGPGLLATELVLDRRLARGECHDVSFLVTYEPRRGTGPASAGRPAPPLFRHVVERPLERLDLSLSFDPAPGAVLACRWRPRDGAETSRRELTVPGCRSYQLVIADPPPGGYGWRWAAAASARARPPRRSGTSAA
jgi:endogenous inhibitor of DNA gyrase (YacG/DUF329 family)